MLSQSFCRQIASGASPLVRGTAYEYLQSLGKVRKRCERAYSAARRGLAGDPYRPTFSRGMAVIPLTFG
jgi:hypothetical protein